MITFYIYPPQDYYDLKQEVLDGTWGFESLLFI